MGHQVSTVRKDVADATAADDCAYGIGEHLGAAWRAAGGNHNACDLKKFLRSLSQQFRRKAFLSSADHATLVKIHAVLGSSTTSEEDSKKVTGLLQTIGHMICYEEDRAKISLSRFNEVLYQLGLVSSHAGAAPTSRLLRFCNQLTLNLRPAAAAAAVTATPQWPLDLAPPDPRPEYHGRSLRSFQEAFLLRVGGVHAPCDQIAGFTAAAATAEERAKLLWHQIRAVELQHDGSAGRGQTASVFASHDGFEVAVAAARRGGGDGGQGGITVGPAPACADFTPKEAEKLLSLRSLTLDMLTVLVLYTMPTRPEWSHWSFYALFNAAMRSPLRSVRAPWDDVLHLMVEALDRLPSHRIQLYRGLPLQLSGSEYAPGAIVVLRGVTSCSSSMEIAWKFCKHSQSGRTMLSLDCQQAKRLDALSMVSHEAEYVLPPGACLRVIERVTMNHGPGWSVCLSIVGKEYIRVESVEQTDSERTLAADDIDRASDHSIRHCTSEQRLMALNDASAEAFALWSGAFNLNKTESFKTLWSRINAATRVLVLADWSAVGPSVLQAIPWWMAGYHIMVTECSATPQLTGRAVRIMKGIARELEPLLQAGSGVDMSNTWYWWALYLTATNPEQQEGAMEFIRSAAVRSHAGAQYRLGDCFARGDGVPQCWDRAVYWFKKAVKLGYVEAQYRLGKCLMKGVGDVVPREGQAMRLFRLAARKGFPKAQCRLGKYSARQEDAHQRWNEAIKWFNAAAKIDDSVSLSPLGTRFLAAVGIPLDGEVSVLRCADRGDAGAQAHLGACYTHGWGVPVNSERAVLCFQRAAAQDNANAQCDLGMCLIDGSGIPQNDAEAVVWFRRAETQNHTESILQLGKCYYWGRGVQTDRQQAVEKYKMAAAKGNPEAHFLLAFCYAKADGVGRDLHEAVLHLSEAAHNDHADAQYKLGRYLSKAREASRDMTRAAQLYEAAANHGHPQYELALCLANGWGVLRNPQEAVRWYQAAESQGHAGAACRLGACQQVGFGLDCNRAFALQWYRIAAGRGHSVAIHILKMVSRTNQPPIVGALSGEHVVTLAWVASGGCAAAQVLLGQCYRYGNSVTRDIYKAAIWFDRAAKLEHPAARYCLLECYAGFPEVFNHCRTQAFLDAARVDFNRITEDRDGAEVHTLALDMRQQSHRLLYQLWPPQGPMLRPPVAPRSLLAP